jgi:hypothetical protein
MMLKIKLKQKMMPLKQQKLHKPKMLTMLKLQQNILLETIPMPRNGLPVKPSMLIQLINQFSKDLLSMPKNKTKLKWIK